MTATDRSRGARGSLPPAQSSQDTYQRILDVAEQMFADRGIYSPSLREITRAAGQRNNSALQYHFGSREGLIEQIMARHGETLTRRRERVMETFAQDGALYDVRRVAELALKPYLEFLHGTPSELAYLVISAELYSDPSRAFDVLPDIYSDPLVTRFIKTLTALIDLPEVLVHERIVMGVWSNFNAAAGRAQMQRHPGDRQPYLDLDAFISNQIDMFTGAITAEVSEETRRLLRERESLADDS